VTDLQVTVWRRYGNFRLYVSDGDRRIGWYDLKTGRNTIDDQAETDAFWSAIRHECDRLRALGTLPESTLTLPPTSPDAQQTPASSALPAGPGTVPPSVRMESAEPPAEPDLALARAGAAAQARATELRRQHPFRAAWAAMFGIRTEAANFAFGARGERVIGRKLDRWAQRGGWHVLHAVPVGRNGADIDHVLIGAFGIITINTKRTRGAVWAAERTMMINGVRVDYLRDSRYERQRVSRLFEQAQGGYVPVSTAIVFVGAKSFTVRSGGPHDVAVLRDARALRGWLRRRGTVLTPERAVALYELARRTSTWQR
jgi:hypothetical protein